MESLAEQVRLVPAVISVPHTGTHAVMQMLGMEGPQILRGHGNTLIQPGRAIYGHCWHPSHPVTVEQWALACEDRQAWMPIRDPAALAASWVKYRMRTLEWLRDALTSAVAIIKALKPILIDIRKLPVVNRLWKPARDESTGAELVEQFPEYFGEYYGRK